MPSRWIRAAARVALAALAALATLTASAGCTKPRAERASAKPSVTEGHVTVADGTRLYYRKVGNGPQTVILRPRMAAGVIGR